MTDSAFLTAHSRFRSLLLYSLLLVLLLIVGNICQQGDFNIFFTANRQFIHRLNSYEPSLYWQTNGLPNSPLSFLSAAPACLLPFSVAISVWDVISLLLWASSAFLWVRILSNTNMGFDEFTKISAATAIAPLYWAIGSHQMIFQVLFFASLACWLVHRKGSSFWAGMCTGAMLMKPHLVALLAIALFAKADRKKTFMAGVALSMVLPLAPFLNTWRPTSDLRDWNTALRRYRSEVFFADEQGLVARTISVTRSNLAGHPIRKTGDAPGLMIPASLGEKIFRMKIWAWALGTGLWIFWWFKNQHRPDGELFAITLAWGLLLSVYSHLYDDLLLLPLALLALQQLRKRWDILNLYGPLWAIQLFLACVPIVAYKEIRWQLEGWSATAYVITLGLIIHLIQSNEQVAPNA